MERRGIYIIIGILILALGYYFLLSSPSNFPEKQIVKIEPGQTLHGIATELKAQGVIRSRVAFEIFASFFGREDKIVSADYYFERRLPVYAVAYRVARGEHELAPVSVTIPEGFDNTQIAAAFSSKLSSFDSELFLNDAQKYQGQLFPDTYFFDLTDTEKKVFEALNENFNKKILPIMPEIESSGHNENDILTMASIIEREAKNASDRAMISGILWKRIKLGMPLQVDATPETYKNLGLPKRPICNPGLATILAAIHPQASKYLYYLHDKGGNIHYAVTFEEHTANRMKYLNSN